MRVLLKGSVSAAAEVSRCALSSASAESCQRQDWSPAAALVAFVLFQNTGILWRSSSCYTGGLLEPGKPSSSGNGEIRRGSFHLLPKTPCFRIKRHFWTSAGEIRQVLVLPDLSTEKALRCQRRQNALAMSLAVSVPSAGTHKGNARGRKSTEGSQQAAANSLAQVQRALWLAGKDAQFHHPNTLLDICWDSSSEETLKECGDSNNKFLSLGWVIY